MQFQRQNNPHGHTVFGTNLGRSIKSAGSRNRDTEYKKKKRWTAMRLQVLQLAEVN